MTSETDNYVNPPDLSMHSEEEEYGDPLQPADREFQLKMAQLRIKELEMRIELVRVSRDAENIGIGLTEVAYGNNMKSDPSVQRRIKADIETHSELPKRELPHFDGNPKNYWAFIKAFQKTIENRSSDDEARLSYLIQYCDGAVKSQIQHCTVLDPSEGYSLAKDILHKRFGQNYMVARAFIDDLLSGPSIQEGDSQSLLHLSHELTVCDVTLRQMNYSSDLNSQNTIQTIVKRLPSRLRFKWAKAVANIRRLDREPEVADLAVFIEERVDGLCSDYGELALSMAKVERVSKRTSNRIDPSLYKKNVHAQQTVSSTLSRQPTCGVCGETHYADKCPKFLAMDLVERHNVVRQKKLCNICLKANHIAKDCKSGRACIINGCGGFHHHLLHPEPKDFAVFSHHTSKQSLRPCEQPSTVALAVIPVLLRNGNRTVNCCAFLDSGSDSSFITKELANALQLRGRKSRLLLKTLTNDTPLQSTEVTFDVGTNDSRTSVRVTRAWIVDQLPRLNRVIPSDQQIASWPHLKGVTFADADDSEVGVLLGSDVPKAHWVIEQRIGQENEPFAVRTLFGWTLMGPVPMPNRQVAVNHLRIAELERDLARFYQQDVLDPPPFKEKEMSVNDHRALKLMESSTTFREGHYEIALPWSIDPASLPNNKQLALRRLFQLRKRLMQSDDLRDKYFAVMKEYLSEFHAERAIESETQKWYLPHHPVFHPMKPEKLRIVFDCAAKYNGRSLNDNLLSGPDLNNSLVGVLLRFRQERIAVMADIKAMFHQVRVPESDRDALRFLWWPDPDLLGPPVEYRMCVHLFGATSSPSCATFALNRTISDNQHKFSTDVVMEAKRCFYVDDCLFSCSRSEEARRFAQQLKAMLADGGFNITKWVSNDHSVIRSLADSDPTIESVQLTSQEQTTHRTLGVNWRISSDVCYFYLQPMSAPPTRRNILSYVASFYDPLGYMAPVVLVAKILLQSLCKQKLGWDELIGDEESKCWSRWSSSVLSVETVSVPRCLKEPGVDDVVEYQLHVFSDASDVGYGAVAYAVLVSPTAGKSCKLLMSRARVAPIRATTVPRLELAAAVIAVKLAKQISTEMTIRFSSISYWSDSLIVLYSIRNNLKRFPTYFANRLAMIHEHSVDTDWHYVETKRNPADLISRGIYADETLKLQRWFKGPPFLLDQEQWPNFPSYDAAVETVLFSTTEANPVQHNRSILTYFDKIDSWHKLLRIVSWLLRYKTFLTKKNDLVFGPLTTSDIRSAEKEILKMAQKDAFAVDIFALQTGVTSDSKSSKNKFGLVTSPLRKLRPILVDGLLRVGGRLQNAPLSFETKHPIILPSKHFVTRLLIQHYHLVNGHMGLSYLVSSLRNRYWVLQANKTIKSVLKDCFKCRRWFARPCQQAMAPLPADRVLSHVRPFTVSGVDYFGPMYVKRGRAIEKRYGCLFTCFSIRAVHIELTYSMDTDSFLCAFSRFAARRGCPERLYSDNGSNFRGAQSDVKILMRAWNQEKITRTLLARECDWIFGPPKASHRGGVWERLIGIVKRALTIILEEQPMTDEVLHTTLLEIERILNDRPLVKQTDDPEDQITLSPNKLLLLSSNESFPVPNEVSCNRFNRRWRQAQYLSDLFWKHWIRRYLSTLQITQTWLRPYRNLNVGELVLVPEENAPRGHWPKGVIEEVTKSDDGLVRQVLVRTVRGIFRRDVRQICRLEGESPNNYEVSD